MTKVYLLFHGPYPVPEKYPQFADQKEYQPDYKHYAGCPYYGRDVGNLDKARTFKTEAAAKATNEFKHSGYEVVEAEISIKLMVK